MNKMKKQKPLKTCKRLKNTTVKDNKNNNIK